MNLNDVGCCPNGLKLVVGGRQIYLHKKHHISAKCTATDENHIEYTGEEYSLYRDNGGWILKKGYYWAAYNGGEECCPRDGDMIRFRSWRVSGQIECA